MIRFILGLLPKPCPRCMTLRAKFVRWLGISLGVMEPMKETKVEQRQGFTQDQIAAIIGAKELEIIHLRMQLNVALERLKKYEPQENVVSEQRGSAAGTVSGTP